MILFMMLYVVGMVVSFCFQSIIIMYVVGDTELKNRHNRKVLAVFTLLSWFGFIASVTVFLLEEYEHNKRK